MLIFTAVHFGEITSVKMLAAGRLPLNYSKKDFIRRIKSGEITKAHLEPLRGMRLGCTCKPKPCHGDIIAHIVNRLFKDDFQVEDLCN